MPWILGFLARVVTYWKPIAGVVVVTGAFWLGHSTSDAACEKRQKQAIIDAMDRQKADWAAKQGRSDAEGKKLEQALADYRKKIQTLDRQLKDEIQNNVIYSTCKPTAAGLRSINSAIRARKGEPAR